VTFSHRLPPEQMFIAAEVQKNRATAAEAPNQKKVPAKGSVNDPSNAPLRTGPNRRVRVPPPPPRRHAACAQVERLDASEKLGGDLRSRRASASPTAVRCAGSWLGACASDPPPPPLTQVYHRRESAFCHTHADMDPSRNAIRDRQNDEEDNFNLLVEVKLDRKQRVDRCGLPTVTAGAQTARCRRVWSRRASRSSANSPGSTTE
jgi:hypothetical protein